jgi:hypothetical protein
MEFVDQKKLDKAVIVVLDGSYVLSQESITGRLMTMPTGFLWCLSQMTTSGRENVGGHCRDNRFAIQGTNVINYIASAPEETSEKILSPSEEFTGRMRIASQTKISWRREKLFLTDVKNI